ncbi:ABC transporter permease [Aureispira anguillae]|uniref:ABC transporter permease n=1 Tax=Aureispira anguillae TaxID=2864201 RepID=A0A916DWM9_9BACT|nr:ABC transporter permease subunit [Aureispira anguillae]BDS14860.1 ABC transporter permease [Aureispira anguillae]
MLHLLQLEWKKVAPNRSFRLAMGMYVILLPLLYLTVKSMTSSGKGAPAEMVQSFYVFPNIWDTIAYWASWLTFFLLVYISIWMVTSEHSFKTMRQNLITGMERRSFLLGKVMMMTLLALFATLYMAIVAYIYGSFAGGYGNPWGHEINAVWRFFVQNMFYMSFAFMLAVLFNRSGLAMIVFFAYLLIVERIIRYLVFLNLLDQLKWGSYFPGSAAWDVVPFYMAKKAPSFNQEIAELILPYNVATGLTIVYTILFLGIAYRVFMTRDL